MKNTNKNTLASMTRVLGTIAVIFALVFSLSTCDDTPKDTVTQSDYYGTWKDVRSGIIIITLSASGYKQEIGTDYIQCAITNWQAAENTHATGKVDFPSGYKLDTTITALNNFWGNIGDNETWYIYLSNDKKKLVNGRGNQDVDSNVIYVKQ
jgi:hypothetical protein